jgi:hypothetical protein
MGILPQTNFLAEKAIGAVVSAGLKLMVLAFIIAVTKALFRGAAIRRFPRQGTDHRQLQARPEGRTDGRRRPRGHVATSVGRERQRKREDAERALETAP